MRVYTRTGDSGDTGLLGGERIPKDHIRTETYGTVDELNSAIGVLIAHLPANETRIRDELLAIQGNLLQTGSRLAGTEESARAYEITPPGPQAVEGLEKAIDRMLDNLPKLESFIIPGGSQSAAFAHLARTICRRAERRLISLIRETGEEDLNGILIYINRLSDYLYAAARTCNKLSGQSDQVWKKA